MQSSNVWSRSRAKMRLLPDLLAQCSAEATAYGKCVSAATTTSSKQELSRNSCVPEFEALRICFRSAAKKGAK
ncbi:hypothetical protein DNTS_004339 [Danionella cerebrum]|uniref:IMS import disulfide relay-system CHCH-CHCH-like Cx9C domain-containing protein n=1 Tax=Danionella cerebrum TaxID=2873325 RepID=A0A553RCM2_9TELE|nr:hypothetical protein DNTS_004339 [Danionella translucida]